MIKTTAEQKRIQFTYKGKEGRAVILAEEIGDIYAVRVIEHPLFTAGACVKLYLKEIKEDKE